MKFVSDAIGPLPDNNSFHTLQLQERTIITGALLLQRWYVRFQAMDAASCCLCSTWSIAVQCNVIDNLMNQTLLVHVVVLG